MIYACCGREFCSYQAYSQHREYSSSHRYNYEPEEWECLACDRNFSSEKSRHQHMSSYHSDRYCRPCERMFMNGNNLMQHMHSKVHMGDGIKCPFCPNYYTTASGVTIHLESGTCKSGLTRTRINEIVRQLDRGNVITKPMITMPGYDRVETIATEQAWNGRGYQCYLCRKIFAALHGLNNHLKSSAHEQNTYRCPGPRCGKEFKALSGLVQHVESESCGVMRFAQVQKQAKNGIENMVGRMITG